MVGTPFLSRCHKCHKCHKALLGNPVQCFVVKTSPLQLPSADR